LTNDYTYYWHVHHQVLCEALTEPIQNRIFYIKECKSPSEVETRLRCMTPVFHPERLPAKWREADAKWREAYAKREEADAKWEEADAKWREAYAEAYAKWREADTKRRVAYAKCLPQIEKLHKQEHPDCPWDGKTIFPETRA
jgi:hypothetical protein